METSKSLIPVPTNFTPKSFWERDEGTTGMLILAFMVFGGGFILYKLLPVIITLLSNIITATVLALVVGLIAMVISSPRTWTLVKYVFKRMSKAITYAFITYDPFGVLRSCRAEIGKLNEKFSGHVNNLRGKKMGLKRVIDGNTNARETAGRLAQNAKKESQARVQRRQFMRLGESNEKLARVYRVMEILEAALTKYQEACDSLVQDIDNEIFVKEQEYTALQESYSAIKAAKAILRGGTDAHEVFDLTMEYLAQNYESKMGEIEGFLRTSQDFIEGFDLQNDLYDQKALEELEKWSKSGDSLLLSGEDKDHLRLFGPNLSVAGLNDTGKTPDYVELLNRNQ